MSKATKMKTHSENTNLRFHLCLRHTGLASGRGLTSGRGLSFRRGCAMGGATPWQERVWEGQSRDVLLCGRGLSCKSFVVGVARLSA